MPEHGYPNPPRGGRRRSLILASSSRGRRELLRRLGIKFDATSPDIDETPLPGENAPDLVQRLARIKAESVFATWPKAIVIGSDQVADLDGEILGKPGSEHNAIEQLRRQSGRTVVFHTGLCVCAPTLAAPRVTIDTVTTRFRTLTDDEIIRYVKSEDVTATAGSIKSEGQGIALVEAIESRDPTSLIGLPLIALRHLLAEAGLSLP